MTPRSRRTVVALATGVLLLSLGAGTALAYWRATGSGSGSASTGAPSGVTVEAVTSGTPASKLIPGGTADLLLQVSNPNSYAVTLVAVGPNGAVTSSSSTCDSSGNGVSVAALTGLTISIPAGANQSVHVPNDLTMSVSSASACQAATFHAPVLITVQK